MIHCQQCGKESLPGANFCMACGTPLQFRCGNCQSAYTPGSRFCGQCGHRLPDSGAELLDQPGPRAVACPRCHRNNTPGAAYCFACGLPFDDAQAAVNRSNASVNPGDLGTTGTTGSIGATRIIETAGTPEGSGAFPATGAFALGRPGGFWVRFLAYVIDGLIVTFAFILIWTTLLGQPFSDFTEPLELSEDYEYSSQAFSRDGLNTLLALVYDTALITIWATTVGKRLFRLYVVRTDGSRVGPGRALARHLASLLSMLILGIGFLMIAFRQDKRGLHDLICDTVVIRVVRR